MRPILTACLPKSPRRAAARISAPNTRKKYMPLDASFLLNPEARHMTDTRRTSPHSVRPWRRAALCLPPALALLIACGSAALRAQAPAAVLNPFQSPGGAVREMPEHEVKARAELRRLATSSSVADRLSAAEQLGVDYMDFSLLWQLMNDADAGVRTVAISAMTTPSCTVRADQPLSRDLAQKMADLLEKDVTPERIRAAFAPGPGRDSAVGRTTNSASTLDHLYRYHDLKTSPADYTLWQRRVLKPLLLAAAGSGTASESLHANTLMLFTALSETSLVLEALPLLLQKLDDPTLPAPWLLPTLETLWSHPLLGHDKPLNILLLAQLSPRLDPLRPRLLAAMKDGQDKEQAARLLSEIAEVIQEARAKLGPPPVVAAEK